jgi:hypothetical protein
MNAMIAWALGFMLSWSPPGRSKIKEAVETPEEGKARYAEIALAAERVAFDPNVTPLFKGPHGRASTMALLLSVAWHESGFRKDVDLGVGRLARGSGTDSCLLQIRVGSHRTQEGWSHSDLVGDREKCFRAGLALMRRSFGSCHRLDQRDWLGVYTRGSCVENEPFSRNRMVLALKTPKAPVDDAAVLSALAIPPGGAMPSAVSSAAP